MNLTIKEQSGTQIQICEFGLIHPHKFSSNSQIICDLTENYFCTKLFNVHIKCFHKKMKTSVKRPNPNQGLACCVLAAQSCIHRVQCRTSKEQGTCTPTLCLHSLRTPTDYMLWLKCPHKRLSKAECDKCHRTDMSQCCHLHQSLHRVRLDDRNRSFPYLKLKQRLPWKILRKLWFFTHLQFLPFQIN